MDGLGQQIEVPNPISDAACSYQEAFVLLPDLLLERPHFVKLSKPRFDHAQAGGEMVSVERKHHEFVDAEFEDFDQSVRFSLRNQSEDRTQLRAVSGLEIRNQLGSILLTDAPVDYREIRNMSAGGVPCGPGIPVNGW